MIERLEKIWQEVNSIRKISDQPFEYIPFNLEGIVKVSVVATGINQTNLNQLPINQTNLHAPIDTTLTNTSNQEEKEDSKEEDIDVYKSDISSEQTDIESKIADLENQRDLKLSQIENEIDYSNKDGWESCSGCKTDQRLRTHTLYMCGGCAERLSSL